MKQTIKRLLLTQSFTICLLLANAQDWRLKVQDKWFIEYGIKSLQVGDKMPDMPLGKVVNNYTGKTRFSDFRGKLVILDFWNTACKSCIAAFPKMEKIQNEFGDKIQIFLVNMSETEEQIKNMEKAKLVGNGNAKIKFPNLPCIVREESVKTIEQYYETGLVKYFRTRGVPFHVWIDGNGIIRVMGTQTNTYPEKIKDLLAGKAVSSTNSLSTTPWLSLDPKKPPYYNFLADFKNTPVKFGSIITPYNNEISTTFGGSMFQNIIDSNAKTIRTSFVNIELLDIYYRGPYLGLTSEQFKDLKIIYSNGELVDFTPGVDTLQYTTTYWEDRNRNNGYTDILKDKDVIKSSYCYEQVVPLELPERMRRQYMLEDLNRYFMQEYGIVGVLERRTTSCYLLVRTSAKDKVASATEKAALATEKGRKFRRVSTEKLYQIFGNVIKISSSFDEFLRGNRLKGKPFLILNQTGWDNAKRLDMLVAEDVVNSIEELKKVLKNYDLDIVEGKKEVEFLVFKKVK